MGMKWRALAYHGVEPEHARAFREQLLLLVRWGFRFCTVTEAIEKFRCGDSGLWASVTFDDGDATVYSVARPVMESLGVRATLYIATDYIATGSRYRDSPAAPALSWNSLRELIADGHEAGSHSHTHVDFTRCRPARLREELELSKRAIQDNLGIQAQHFSFPYGQYDSAVLSAARDTGLYETLATIDRGFMRAASPVLKRDVVSPQWPARKLAWTLRWGASPLYGAWRQVRLLRRSLNRDPEAPLGSMGR